MRLILLGSISALLLSGCDSSTYTKVWRDGASLVDQDYAVTDCAAFASRQVPSAMSVQTTPVYRTPVSTQCSNYGNQVYCQSYGGQTYGGQSYSYDANADLRDRVYLQCLAKLGFKSQEFARCTPEQAKKGIVVTKLPAASKVACITKDDLIVLN